MNYIIVEVYLPAAEKTYDIKLPRASKIWEVTKLIAAALSELSKGLYQTSENPVLLERETGAIFNINLSVEEAGLVNGSKLMLI